MFHVRQIENLDLPELAPYRTLKRPIEHEAQGIFVAEGDKVVRRLLESHFEVVSVLLPAARLAEFEPLLATRKEKQIPVYSVVRKGMLEELIGFEMFQGVLAVGKIPATPTLDSLLALPSPRLLVAVDGLTSAENMGVLTRNCAAFGVQALIVGETCASPFLRRAVRNSMGTIFRLPVLAAPNLAAALGHLQSQGVRCVAAHPHTEQRCLSQTDLHDDCCLVFGSEGHGISPTVLAACAEAVAIPMSPGVDSLNVSAAAAVFLYEANRQRDKRLGLSQNPQP
jgi:tRNA G18 (ribose-2'-O)-methylase SpoU